MEKLKGCRKPVGSHTEGTTNSAMRKDASSIARGPSIVIPNNERSNNSTRKRISTNATTSLIPLKRNILINNSEKCTSNEEKDNHITTQKTNLNKDNDNETDEQIPYLNLKAPGSSKILSFGSTYPLKIKVKHFCFVNPFPHSITLRIYIQPLKNNNLKLNFENTRATYIKGKLVEPNDKACKLSVTTNLNNYTFEIPPETKQVLPLTWHPSKVGNLGTLLSFVDPSRNRSYGLTVHGIASLALERQSLSERFSTKRTAKSSLSREMTGKRSKPIEPNNISSATVLGWEIEPNASFVNYLNLELCQPDLFSPEAYMAESPSTFTRTFDLLHLWDRAQAVMETETFKSSYTCFLNALNTNKFQIKKGINWVINMAHRRDLARILHVYNKMWLNLVLRLVLEESNILTFTEEDAQFNEELYQGLFGYINEDDSPIIIAQFLLAKVFKVILFLDQARTANLMPKDAGLKSNSDVVTELATRFLEAPDTALQRLSQAGFQLQFVQSDVDQVVLRSTNLASDLRDGTRLFWLVALHTQDWSGRESLIAAPSTLEEKVQNLELSFHIMKKHEIINSRLINGPTYPIDIAQGHRDKTIGLLWTFIWRWKLQGLIASKWLESELLRLEARHLALTGLVWHDIAESTLYPSSPLIDSLLRWCYFIGHLYGIKVGNFTRSFENGRLLCYLLAHYLPKVLNPCEIKRVPDSNEMDIETPVQGSSFAIFSFKKQRTNPVRDAIKENFDLFKSTSHYLDGVPNFASFRVDGNINEWVVITYTAHLLSFISRTLTYHKAATKIQRFWRKKGAFYRLELERMRQRQAIDLASRVIQKAFKQMQAKKKAIMIRTSYTQLKKSSIFVQSLVRMKRVRIEYLIKKRSAIRIQSLIRGHSAKQQFKKAKSATNKIQCIFRAFVARQSLKLLRQQSAAATKISKSWRGYVCRKGYSLIKDLTLLIQARWRAYKVGTDQRKAYLQLLRHTTIVQRLYRKKIALWLFTNSRLNACLVLQRFLRRRKLTNELLFHSKRWAAAKKIQTVYRGYHQLRLYTSLRSAVVKCQIRRRSLIVGRYQNCNYSCLRRAALFVQARYRLVTHLDKLKQTRHEAAVIIQKNFRCYIFRRRYSLAKSRIIHIQQLRRASVTTKAVIQKYTHLRSATIFLQYIVRQFIKRKRRFELCNFAATVLQSYVRRYQAIKRLEWLKLEAAAATKIQSVFRMLRERNAYLRLISLIIYTQRKRRATLEARSLTTHFNRLKDSVLFLQNRFRFLWYCAQLHNTRTNAAIDIQTAWRGYFARKKLLKLREEYWAATTLQKFYRTKVAYQAYLKIQSATINLQRRWRSLQLTRFHQASFYQLKASTSFIQVRFRFVKHYRALCATRNAAATKIQSIWLVFKARLELFILRCATASTKIGAYYRMAVKRQAFLRLKDAATIVSKARRRLMLTRSMRQEYLELKITTIQLQRIYRHYSFGKMERTQYLTVKSAALKIQKILRMYWFKQDVKFRSAVKIQANWRRYTLQRNYKAQVRIFRAAALIQAKWRSYSASNCYQSLKVAANFVAVSRRRAVETRNQRSNFIITKVAATTLQRAYRNKILSTQVRHRYLEMRSAAIKIQSWWKMLPLKRHYLKLKAVSNYLTYRRRQSVINRNICFNYRELLTATILLQRAYRNMILSRMIKDQFSALKAAAIKIQSLWRCRHARLRYANIKRASGIVQTRRRALLLTRQARNSLTSLKQVTIFCQRIFRHNKFCNSVRHRFLHVKQATVKIQNVLRTYWERRRLENVAATNIQKTYRMFIMRKQFKAILKAHNATIILQKLVRGYFVRKRYEKIRMAVGIITSRRRATLLTRSYMQHYQALKLHASIVQAKYRHKVLGQNIQAHYQLLRSAASTIQFKYREHYQFRVSSAVVIQKAWNSLKMCQKAKKVVSRKRVLRKLWNKSIIKVLCLNRVLLHFKGIYKACSHNKTRVWKICLQKWNLNFHTKVEMIRQAQLVRKQAEASIRIQTLVKTYLARRHFNATKLIAKALQRIWRGHKVRKTNNNRIANARRKVKQANAQAQPHLILSNRTTLALSILSSSRSLTQIIQACEHLVVVTRLSPACRLRLIDQYHVIKVILALMRSCNRSQPHQEILKHAVLILENLSRDPNCAPKVLHTSQEVDDILVTMCAHRELKHILEGLLVTLSNLIAYPHLFPIIQEAPSILTKLETIRGHIKRKLRIKGLGGGFQGRKEVSKLKGKFLYSVGLQGFDSTKEVDPLELVQNLITFLSQD